MEEYLGRRGRDEYHSIIVEHGALMEYERNNLIFGKALFPSSKFVILMFLSYFHYWILILKQVLNRYERTKFVSISFIAF